MEKKKHDRKRSTVKAVKAWEKSLGKKWTRKNHENVGREDRVSEWKERSKVQKDDAFPSARTPIEEHGASWCDFEKTEGELGMDALWFRTA